MVKSVWKWIGMTVLLIGLVSFGCSSAPAASSPAQTNPIAPTSNAVVAPFQVVDQMGRTVKFDKTPQRIISLAPSNTEILYALGLGDKVVGVTSYDNYPPEVSQKPVIGGFSTPDIEKVVALSPDLILAAPIHQQEIIPQLESRGLTVLGLNPVDVNGVSDAINLLGKVTGKTAEAAALVAQLGQRSQAITKATAGLSQSAKPRVLYVVWHDPLMTAGASTMIDDLITRTGGINIASELSGYTTINLETVIQRNPQIILVISSMGDSTSFDYIKNEPRFQSTDAIKNNRLYSLDSDIFGRTTPRIVDGMEQMAKLIHPELFK